MGIPVRAAVLLGSAGGPSTCVVVSPQPRGESRGLLVVGWGAGNP